MLSSQLWESPREHTITNKRTVKGKLWGLQLTAPVRAPMTVFNKMSSEARVTIPKLSPSAYSCEKMLFFFLLISRLDKNNMLCVCFCHGMAFGRQGLV